VRVDRLAVINFEQDRPYPGGRAYGTGDNKDKVVQRTGAEM